MQEHWYNRWAEKGRSPDPDEMREWADYLADRTSTSTISLPDWREAVEEGIFVTREDYLAALRSFCMCIGEKKLGAALLQKDEQLLRMVKTLDELSEILNHFTERLADWYSTYDPHFARKDHPLRERDLLAQMHQAGDEIFISSVNEAEHLLSLRTSLSREVSRRAEEAYPNCSALVGGLVASRLLARAGGLERFARMSSATIQVLGAENALFSHLHAGTPPPKHGIIYQHKRVHAAPREVRGRVARVIAGRLSLAARLDFYREKLVPEFVEEAQKRIDRAGKKR